MRLPYFPAANLLNEKTIVIDQEGGGDYDNFADAFAAVEAESPSSVKHFKIQVRTGSYTVDNSGGPLEVPGYTNVEGDSADGVIVSPSDTTQALFEIDTELGQIQNMSITSVTSNAGIVNSHNGGVARVRGVKFYNCSTGIEKSGFGSLFVRETEWLSGIGTYGILHEAGTVIARDLYLQNCPTAIQSRSGLFWFNGVEVNGGQNGLYADIASGFGGFYGANFQTLNCLTAGVRADGAGFVIMLLTGGLVTTFGAGNCVQQDSATATINIANSVLMSNKISLTNADIVNLDFTDFQPVVGPNSFQFAGKRHKRGSYAASGQTLSNERIVATTAGGLALTLPSAVGVVAEYPIRQKYVDESGLGTSIVAPPGGSTLDGGAAAVAIPAAGSLEVYGYGTTWFTS